MSKNDFEYEYDYHRLAENADYMDDEIYYDDGTDEPWVEEETPDTLDEYQEFMSEYQNYYHNLLDEIED